MRYFLARTPAGISLQMFAEHPGEGWVEFDGNLAQHVNEMGRNALKGGKPIVFDQNDQSFPELNAIMWRACCSN